MEVVCENLVRLKYAFEVYWNPGPFFTTWALWSCSSAVIFSFLLAVRIVSNTNRTVCAAPILYATIFNPKEYGIAPSMSRRGNRYDNAMAENFFSILKTECIYRTKIKNFTEARILIDEYIWFYNNERIQLKTGEAPLTRRFSA